MTSHLSTAPLRTVAETIYVNLVAPRTRERIRVDMKRWERLTGNPPVNQIGKETLRCFRNSLVLEGYAPDTIVTTLGSVLTILREACDEWDLIEHVPRLGRSRVSRKTPEPRGATVEQINAVFRKADEAAWPILPGVSPGQFWRAWIALTAWTGLRVSDSIVDLKLEHLVDADRCIQFRASKTKKKHVFPMPEWLNGWLRPLRVRRSNEDRLFPVALHRYHGSDTQHRVPKIARDTLAALCKSAEVDRIFPKNLRQFAITQWTIASPRAGEIIHGCGIPKVLTHYLGVLRILEAAEERVAMPEDFL